jgi:hypothetical protein
MLTADQIRRRDQQRRAAASPPVTAAVVAPSVYPGGVYFSAAQPTNVLPGALWVPLNTDGSPKATDQWQVFS